MKLTHTFFVLGLAGLSQAIMMGSNEILEKRCSAEVAAVDKGMQDCEWADWKDGTEIADSEVNIDDRMLTERRGRKGSKTAKAKMSRKRLGQV